MAKASLAAEARTETGKGTSRKLRAAGRIPGVIYGHAREAQGLSLNARDLDRLLSTISAGSTVVELTVDGTASNTLIREIQRHPFKKVILHVDFQELVAGEKVTVNVPLVFVGTPEGVRLSGALLEQIVHSVEVLADPTLIPNHIDVDVSHLAMGHSLHVRDIKVPAGIEIVSDGGLTLCACVAPRAAVEAAAAEGEPGAAEPELIRKAKEEEAAK